jgi:hypothetical protein
VIGENEILIDRLCDGENENRDYTDALVLFYSSNTMMPFDRAKFFFPFYHSATISFLLRELLKTRFPLTPSS